MNVTNDDHRLIAECLAGNTPPSGSWSVAIRIVSTTRSIRLVDNGEDALDVVQEAFLHAYQSLESFKGDALFFTWLYRIAVNTAISLRRKRRVLVRIDTGARRRAAARPAGPVGPGPARTRHRAGRGGSRNCTEPWPDSRPNTETVLVMKELEGQKYEDMAETLGVPIGTIRSRLHRARLELRELLEQEEQAMIYETTRADPPCRIE